MSTFSATANTGLFCLHQVHLSSTRTWVGQSYFLFFFFPWITSSWQPILAILTQLLYNVVSVCKAGREKELKPSRKQKQPDDFRVPLQWKDSQQVGEYVRSSQKVASSDSSLSPPSIGELSVLSRQQNTRGN